MANQTVKAMQNVAKAARRRTWLRTPVSSKEKILPTKPVRPSER